VAAHRAATCYQISLTGPWVDDHGRLDDVEAEDSMTTYRCANIKKPRACGGHLRHGASVLALIESTRRAGRIIATWATPAGVCLSCSRRIRE